MKKHKTKKQKTANLLTILLMLTGVVLILFIAALAKHNWKIEKVIPSLFTPTPIVDHTDLCTVNKELVSAGDIPISQDYIPYDSPRRPGEVRKIEYIIIHETDNRNQAADAFQHSLFLSQNTTDITGWHYSVDDHAIVHHIPDNEIAWNAGDKRTKNGGNMNGIAIEMCVNYGNDYDKTLRNTAILTAALLQNYNLTPDALRFHADFMEKECPHRLISEGRLEEFRQMVKDQYRLLQIKAREN